MPTEQQMLNMKNELDALAAEIEADANSLTTKATQRRNAKESVELSRGQLLEAITNERHPANNKLVYTNDLQRQIELRARETSVASHVAAVSAYVAKNTEEENLQAAIEEKRRLHNSKMTLMQFYANSASGSGTTTGTGTGTGTGGGTTAPQIPAAPSALVATTSGSSQIDLAWVDNSSDETGFRIERSTDGANFAEIGTTAANAFSATGLTAGTKYYFRVRAYNSAGNSAYSATVSETTSAAGGGGTTSYPVCATVRFLPRQDIPEEYAPRAQGGIIEGSNVSPTSGFAAIGSLPASVTKREWQTVALNNSTAYKFLRLRFPEALGAWSGDMSEIEFKTAGGSVIAKAATFGSGGWYENNVYANAFDGDPNTVFGASGNSVETIYGIEVAPI